MSAYINLYTMYKWYPALFDGLQLPSPVAVPTYPDLYVDMPEIKKDTIINRLLWKTAELEVYPAEPELLSFVIRDFSETQLDRWQALYNSYYFKFNPLWNKDGLIERTSAETHDMEHAKSGSDTSTSSRTSEGESETTESSTGTLSRTTAGTSNVVSTEKVAAFNTAATADRTITTTDTTTSGTESGTDTTNKTTNFEGGETETETGTTSYNSKLADSGTISHEEKIRETGNIGVTKTTDLIKDFRSMWETTIYDTIINDIVSEICLLVY